MLLRNFLTRNTCRIKSFYSNDIVKTYPIFRVFCSCEVFVWRVRRVFAQCFFQKERGLFEAWCCYMHFLRTLKRKKINLVTKSEGNFALSEIFDFAIKRVCYKWRNCFSAKSFTDGEFLPLRYMNTRFILEDIKMLLFC